MRQVKVTRIFHRNLSSKAAVLINRGSARSSKSYSIMQYLAYLVTNSKCKILVTRKTTPALVNTVYTDFINMMKDYGYYQYCVHNKTYKTLHYLNGSSILFTGLDDPERIKSSEFNYIFMEEATEFRYDDYMILKTRLSAPNEFHRNQLIMSFNPVDAFHWIKIKVLDIEDDVEEIVSTYKDNPFLSKDYIKLLEATKEQDWNYWKIYGLGEWGSLEHVIYNNWTEITGWPDNIQRTIYGCDFGFNAPTAIVEIGLVEDKVFVREKLYRSGMTNSDLTNFILSDDQLKNGILYCDAAEPARISELRKNNIDALPADKSVKDGIDFVKRQKLHITSDSPNILKEIRAYSYKEKQGIIIDEPIKLNDHACFVAGTKVLTIDGYRNIEDINIDDLVITTAGPKKVIDSACTGIKHVNEYQINNTKLICTPDHPFITPTGKKAITDIEVGDTTLSEDLKCLRKLLNSMEKSFICLTTDIIEDLRKTAPEFCIYIEKSINTFQDKIYQSDIMSTIKTAIKVITLLTILNVYLDQNIYQSTVSNTTERIQRALKNILMRLDRLLKNGMRQKKVASGTESMVKEYSVIDHIQSKLVNCVELNTELKRQATQDSVPTNVEPNIAAMLDLIMKQEYAVIVAELLKSIDIVKQSVVQSPVLLNTVGNRKTYNLTIEDRHEYFANGVLVSNCDAMRYALYTHLGIRPNYEIIG